MKRALALAVASAFAVHTAYADSGNVNISGWIEADVSYEDITGKNVRDNLIAIDGRLNFTGTEDLGNGLSTIWQIGAKINEGESTNQWNPSAIFGSNDTFIGLKGSFGQVRLGKMLTPYYEIVDWPLSSAGMGKIMDAGDPLKTSGGYETWKNGDRVDNSIRYDSPDFGGFSASAMYYTAENKNSTGRNSQSFSSRLAYANGSFNTSLGYQYQGDNAGTDGNKLSSIVWQMGYSFGNFGIYGGVKQTKLSGNGLGEKRNYWEIGATYSASDKLSFRAAYGQAGDQKGKYGSDDGAKEFAFQTNYSLSKRTSVHLRFNQIKNDIGRGWFGEAGKTGRRYMFILAHSF
ncbi:porin [Leeia aquatica]|uniref:Porin n=1 Tax=Leeia aquatica TaxID=2725557 RepID=A0A847S7B6_9NEIS|nr:porin [Leeia aquatica]NLR74735.1 porin [Leeia aquatica]